jgi:hypothetical protein
MRQAGPTGTPNVHSYKEQHCTINTRLLRGDGAKGQPDTGEKARSYGMQTLWQKPFLFEVRAEKC